MCDFRIIYTSHIDTNGYKYRIRIIPITILTHYLQHSVLKETQKSSTKFKNIYVNNIHINKYIYLHYNFLIISLYIIVNLIV